jgi:hypothetical protein
VRGGLARPALTAVAVALTVVSAACGDDRWKPSPAARANARSTVQTWLDACWRENGEAALAPLTPAAREIVLKGPGVLAGCEQLARLAPGTAPPPPERLKAIFTRARVESVKMDAGYGTATVRSPAGPPIELDLELDRGTWQLSHPQLPGR